MKKTLLLALAITITVKTFAQAPSPTCNTAGITNLTVGSCVSTQTISDATAEGTTPAMSCIGSGTFQNEGWYTFTAPGGQALTVTACTGTITSNLLLQVISGACGVSEVEVGCANLSPAGAGQSEAISCGVLAAGTYFIRVVNVGAAVNMSFTTICVNTTPANDECTNATPLTPSAASGACFNTFGTDLGATQSLAANCSVANSANDDVWFSFTAFATMHTVTVTPGSTFNPVFELFSACPANAGNSVGCVGAAGLGNTSTHTFTGLSIGTTYYLRVYDNGTSCSPSVNLFSVCVQTPPINDDCAGATHLNVNATCVTTPGDDNLATSSGIAVSSSCAGSNPDDDEWYYFQAPGTCAKVQVHGSASYKPCFEVFDVGNSMVCPIAANSTLCNASTTGGATISNQFPTTVGNYYYIRVYDYGTGTPATTTYNICVMDCQPTNDTCGGTAITSITPTCVLGANELVGNVGGATQTTPPCSGTVARDVWYNFTTSHTLGEIYCITVTGSGSFDAVLQVDSASCGGNSIVCVNATGIGGIETISLTAGVQIDTSKQYWVRVYHNSANPPATTTFDICITDCTAVGINENANNNDITIYPNPTTGEFNVSSLNHKIESIKVMNVLGEVILQSSILNPKSSINMNGFAKGIYFISIIDVNKNVVNKKLIIQ